ncbi:NAD-dependent epimerase/dehydratase family protein [Fusibacter bizertensis]
MKVLLTGSSGFIGKNVFNKLSTEFDFVCVSSTSSQSDRISVHKNFENIEEILSDYDFECIVHLAAVIPSSFSSATFDEVFYPNALMMDRLFNLAVHKNIKTFIYLSTFGSMVDYKNFKMKDYYTLSKIHGEHVCSMMASKGIRAVSLRIPSPYGEYSNPNNVINQFAFRALKNEDLHVYGSGSREQNFVYIDDIVDAIKYFILNPIESDVYEIVSSSNVNMETLARLIVKISNSSSEIIIGEKPDMQEAFRPKYDSKLTYEKTGFQCKHTLEEGLTDYLSILKENL